MKPRVFMLMPHRQVDVSAADTFGEITYLFRAGEKRPTFWDPAFIETALDRLWDHAFDPANDYFMVAGHMAPVVKLCCAIAYEYPTARGLFWDAVDARYASQALLVPSILETEDGDDPKDSGALLEDASAAPRVRDGRRRSA